jgi:hypothetical protein
MKKSIIILLTLGLIIASGTAYAATVDLHGLTKVAPSKGTFFFDVDISDVGSLPNWDSWQLFLTMTGGTNANFVNFSNLATNEDYLFFGDSGDYSFFLGSLGFIAVGSDFTPSETGVTAEVGDLLARITVDVSNAQPGEVYTISLLPERRNWVQDDTGEFDFITQLQPDYSFQVVPIPGAVWLLGSGLIGLLGLRRRFKS